MALDTLRFITGSKPHNVAVLLARVSSREQEEEGYSLPAQVRLLRAYCVRQGLAVDRVFEIAESASGREQRKVFIQMMSYLRRQHVDHLVCEKVDRLTRNLKDAVTVEDWLAGNENRRMHLVKNMLVLHKNSPAQDRLNWDMQLVLAKNFIDNLREEVAKGVQEKLAAGWYPGRPPVGYKTVGQAGHRVHVVDPERAPLVMQAFELYAAGGYSMETLAEKMASRGLYTSRGHHLGRSQIDDMLRNPFYIGTNVWEGKQYPGAQEPLISKELFERVQAVADRGRAGQRRRHLHPLLQGLVRCSQCRRLITWQKQKDHWYGTCPHAVCTRRAFVRQDQIEKQLEALIAPLTWPPKPIHDWAVAALQANQAYAVELQQLSREQLTKRNYDLRRQLKRLYVDRLEGRLPVEQYDQYAKPIMVEQEQVKRRLALIHPEAEPTPAELALGQRLVDVYRTSSAERRRGLIGWLFGELWLGLDKVLAAAYSPAGRLMAGLKGLGNVGYLGAAGADDPDVAGEELLSQARSEALRSALAGFGGGGVAIPETRMVGYCLIQIYGLLQVPKSIAVLE